MDASSFTYSTRNIFSPPAAMNHSFTGGDVWSHKNVERGLGADEYRLPQVFLEMSRDLQGINEISSCSSETRSQVVLSLLPCPHLSAHTESESSPWIAPFWFHLLPRTPSLTQLWLLSSHSCSSNTPSILLPQRLCIDSALCLEYFSPGSHTAHLLPSSSLKVLVPIGFTP